jgi:hypothetical protein
MLEKEIQDRIHMSTRYNLRNRTTGLSATVSYVESGATGSSRTLPTTQIPSPNSSPSSQEILVPRHDRHRTNLLAKSNRINLKFVDVERQDLAKLASIVESSEKPSYFKQSEKDLQAKTEWEISLVYYANMSKLVEYFSSVPDLEVFPEETCLGAATIDPRIPKSVKQALLGEDAEIGQRLSNQKWNLLNITTLTAGRLCQQEKGLLDAV